ncbi:MAG TPA: DUF4386 domain-containing protein [Thermoanaerobaculia bacterium]|nr:DUF4386 domain-containing protein [Thermoanaerobaculia bacterium]
MTAPFSLIYVPNKLIVRGDAAATASNVAAHETMFRLAIVNELLGSVMFVFLAFALYRLLQSVDRMLAAMMTILALLSIPISFAGAACEVAALEFLKTPDLAMLLIRLHGKGIVVNEIFWGLWLFPFGILVIRSGFLPRILGVLLIVNAFAYPIDSVTYMLSPDVSRAVGPWLTIAETGELWIMLCLLFWRIKPPAIQTHVAAGAIA